MITRAQVIAAAFELLVEQYKNGVSLDTLAKRHKITRHSLTNMLRASGDFVDGRKNKPKLDLCKRGHDMATFGNQLYTKDGRKNGRECLECKRVRARVDYKENN